MSPSSGDGVVLVLTNFADEGCGVGSSEAVVADLAPVPVVLLDPLAGSLPGFVARARRALRGQQGAVVAYPTRDQVERLRLIPRYALLRLLVGRRGWIRVHLHEFDHLRRRQRVVVAALVGLVADKVVVSSELEADALRRRYRGWGARGEVVVVPPANGSAPEGPLEVRLGTDRSEGTVGVIGQYRLDKNEAWLFDTLLRLDGRFRRLEVIGPGWDALVWPAAVRARYQVELRGHVPAADLAPAITTWDLALAPFDHHVHDGRLSLRTPLAHGVPTVAPGPRPPHLRLAPPHLHFDDEVSVGSLGPASPARRAEGAAAVAALEARWRAQLVEELWGP